MKLYAQQGHGTGSDDRNRILAGLRDGYLHGAIYSPKDYGADRTIAALDVMAQEFPAKDRLFDPQFYAAVVAHEPDGRFGKLMSGEDYPYFEPRRRAQLESENRVRADLQACLQFQNNLQVTASIAPNIVIRQRFNSIEAVIAKNFIRNAKEIWTGIDKTRPVYATLAMDAEALQDRNELNEFLAEITILEQPPDGFYLLVNNPSSGISPELVDPRTLAGWLYLNHSLKLNGFGVINGFSDILTPFLSAAGGDAGATGWYSTQKVFSMDRFAPPTPGGRRPVLRYLSKALLNSIRFDEFHRLRGAFPDIVNGLPTSYRKSFRRGTASPILPGKMNPPSYLSAWLGFKPPRNFMARSTCPLECGWWAAPTAPTLNHSKADFDSLRNWPKSNFEASKAMALARAFGLKARILVGVKCSLILPVAASKVQRPTPEFRNVSKFANACPAFSKGMTTMALSAKYRYRKACCKARCQSFSLPSKA